MRKALALGHLESKQQKKVSEIRRILPNLGEFDQFRRFITRKANFCGQTDGQTDGRTETFRPSELGYQILGPPEFRPSELGYQMLGPPE